MPYEVALRFRNALPHRGSRHRVDDRVAYPAHAAPAPCAQREAGPLPGPPPPGSPFRPRGVEAPGGPGVSVYLLSPDVLLYHLRVLPHLLWGAPPPPCPRA